MLAEIFKSTIDLLKLAPRYLIAITLITGALLFIPGRWLEHIGLQEFASNYRQWLGFGFLVSLILWLVSIATTIWEWIAGMRFRHSVNKRVIQKLSNLTEDEKQILRYYIAKNTRANMLKVDDGVVQGLVRDRIIYRSASMGNLIEGFAHNISNSAWDHLHANPQLLNGTTNSYRTDKRDW